jgi:hypothetical protein
LGVCHVKAVPAISNVGEGFGKEVPNLSGYTITTPCEGNLCEMWRLCGFTHQQKERRYEPHGYGVLAGLGGICSE